MNEHQTVQQAKDAVQVLDNPAYQSAMKSLRDAIVQQWKDCPVRDKEGQLLLLQLAKLTDKFEGILNGMIETGKLAQHKIDIDAERSDGVVRKWFRKVA